MSIYGVQWLPAVVCAISLFILVRLIIIPMKYRRGANIVALSLSGFFGYFIFLPFPFYDLFYESYVLVPIAFFAMAFVGFVLCLLTNVNPLDPKDILFKKTENKNDGEK